MIEFASDWNAFWTLVQWGIIAAAAVIGLISYLVLWVLK